MLKSPIAGFSRSSNAPWLNDSGLISVPGYDPVSSLFGNNERGFLLDFTDFSTMFQTADTSTPVVGESDLIYRINDKTPNGLHAIQATESQRPFPIFREAQQRWGASFDASNFMQLSQNLDLSNTDKVTFWMAVEKGPGGDPRVWLSHGGTSSGSFEVFGPRNVGFDYAYSMSPRTNTAREAFWVDPAIESVTDYAVITGTANISASPIQTISRNGATPSVQTGSLSSRNFLSAATYIGSRLGSLIARGTLHAICVLGREATPQEIADMNAWMAQKVNVTLVAPEL